MSTTKLLAKSFETPDEVRTFEKGKVERATKLSI